MLATQKCQYALRALIELAKHGGEGPVKISLIAQEQVIPIRFLEVILGQLKQGGFVESRRGAEGGYLLARAAGQISVADVLEFVDGPIGRTEEGGGHVLEEVWRSAAQKLRDEFQATSIADLRERELELASRFIPNYQI